MWRCVGAYVGPARLSAFSRFVAAEHRRVLEEHSFRAWVTEQMRAVVRGQVLQQSWLDMVGAGIGYGDGMTGGEIAADVIARAGLEVV